MFEEIYPVDNFVLGLRIETMPDCFLLFYWCFLSNNHAGRYIHLE